MTKGGTETYNGNGPQCPYCEHEHKDDELQSVPSLYICKGCGRRLSIEVHGGSMNCSGCGRSHECDNCIDGVHARIFCSTPQMHKWQPTLAIDMEKCSNCYDIRRVPVPTSSSSTS